MTKKLLGKIILVWQNKLYLICQTIFVKIFFMSFYQIYFEFLWFNFCQCFFLTILLSAIPCATSCFGDGGICHLEKGLRPGLLCYSWCKLRPYKFVHASSGIRTYDLGNVYLNLTHALDHSATMAGSAEVVLVNPF